MSRDNSLSPPAAEDGKPAGLALPDDDGNPKLAARADMDRAALRLHDALSDLSRCAECPLPERRLVRLAEVLEALVELDRAALPQRTARKIAVRLDKATARIERLLAERDAAGSKRAYRLDERLRQERKRLKATLRAAAHRTGDESQATERAGLDR